MNDVDQLEELECRVGAKWIAAAAARTPLWSCPADPFGGDMSAWTGAMTRPLPPGTMQFPRERWASYPARRRLTLMVCEKLLDAASDLNEEHWMTLCLAMQFGGKTRLA